MIDSTASHLIVREAGRPVPLDLHALHTEMRTCCATVGLHESWLAEQAVAALEDSLLARPDDAPPLERTEIDRLITRLLLAAGYGDVAAEFCRRRKQAPFLLDASPTEPWDEVRLRNLFARRLPVASEILAALVRETCERLDRLGLTQVTDSLLIDLAVHLLREPGLVTPLPPNSPWLLLPEQVDALCRGTGAHLRRQEVLRLQPISRLLPTVRITLDLERLAATLGNPPLTELEFWPALLKAVRAARRSLEAVRRALPSPARASADIPARVLVVGFPALARSYLGPLSRVATRTLARDIEALIRTETVDHAGFPVIVTPVENG